MKEATIYYSRTPHPSESKYWGKKYSPIHHGDKKSVTMKSGFFKTYWRRMPVKEYVDDKKLEASLNKIYAKYNEYKSNPYSSDNKGQHIIKEKSVHHTTMSVEDVIKVGKTYYVVAGQGFKRLKLV